MATLDSWTPLTFHKLFLGSVGGDGGDVGGDGGDGGGDSNQPSEPVLDISRLIQSAHNVTEVVNRHPAAVAAIAVTISPVPESGVRRGGGRDAPPFFS